MKTSTPFRSMRLSRISRYGAAYVPLAGWTSDDDKGQEEQRVFNKQGQRGG